MPQFAFEYQFSYRPFVLETGSQKTLTPPLPVIETALSYHGLTRTALALIDSGSTFSLFSREIADGLEITVLQGRVQKLSTLGGPLIAYGHEVEIEIMPDFHYQAEVLFSEYPIPRNLLGHNGFLEQVAVALRSKYGLIYLNPEI
jgi:hypothetical protein